jgi:hypothetical protein
MRVLAELLMVVALAACVSAPEADPPGKRIEEANFLAIGGIEQWVTIRGDDDHKPVCC